MQSITQNKSNAKQKLQNDILLPRMIKTASSKIKTSMKNTLMNWHYVEDV